MSTICHMKNFTFKDLKKYICDYRFNSLLIRNFGLILLLIVLPITLCVFFYYTNMQRILKDEIATMNQNSLKQTVDTMDSTLEDAKQITINLSLRTDVNLLKYKRLEQLRGDSDAVRIIEDLTLITSLYHYIDSIYIYYESNNLVFYNGQIVPFEHISDYSWLSFYEEASTRKIYFQYREKKDFYPYLLTLIYPIYSDMGNKAGAVITNINIENWGNIGEYNHTDMTFYCLDDTLQVYYSNNYSLFSAGNAAPENLDFLSVMQGDFTSQMTIDGQQMLVSCMGSSHMPLKYVSLTPLSAYQQKINSFNFTMKIVLFCGVAFCFLISIVMTFRTYEPVLSIIQLLDQETENIPLSKRQRPDEIFFIKNQFHSSKQKNIQLQETLTQQMKKLNRAQLDALQTQINPHFLYNTLDTINWMSIKHYGGKNEISYMVSELGKLLCICLEKSSYLVSVNEEINHTNIYLNILKQRYQNRLNIEWDIDERILDCQIVKLSIQPIVENAVMHGLRQKRYFGTILIQGRLNAGYAIISVTDNGVGMTPEDMEHLQKSLNEESEDDSHIGLRNVHKRFLLLFGNSFGVSLSQPTAHESGLTVTLKFPDFII